MKTQYDAKYRGAKAPTADELKAMRFELSLLMKDLGSSAKRYASNIRMAKMAMLEMEEEERSVFAKILSQIIHTGMIKVRKTYEYVGRNIIFPGFIFGISRL